jgi:hypothetical protein
MRFMATKTLIVDDIDGVGEATTVSLSYDGTQYEVDLSKKNRTALEKALKPYLDAARKVSGADRHITARRGAATSRGRRSSSVDLTAVRAWAAKSGITVAPRGRIAAWVIEQYQAAQ